MLFSDESARNVWHSREMPSTTAEAGHLKTPRAVLGVSLGLHADVCMDFRVNSLRAEDGDYSALKLCEET